MCLPIFVHLGEMHCRGYFVEVLLGALLSHLVTTDDDTCKISHFFTSSDVCGKFCEFFLEPLALKTVIHLHKYLKFLALQWGPCRIWCCFNMKLENLNSSLKLRLILLHIY